MVHGTVRHFFQILGALGLVLFGALPLLAWRISTAPLSLDFLTPYVEEALTPPGRPYTIKLDKTVLYWAGWQRTLDVQAVGVTVAADDGTPIAAIPALSLGLSLRALSVGLIAPRTIELLNGRLHLLRRADGRIEVDLGGQEPVGAKEGAWKDLLESALAAPDLSAPTGYLTRFRLASAKVTIDDETSGATWAVDSMDLDLVRDRQGIGVAGAFSVVTPDGPARFDIDGRYATSDRRISLRGKFAAIRPASFAKVAPQLDMLAGLDLPVSGAVSVKLDSDGTLRQATADLSATSGTLRVPGPLANTYDIRTLKAHAEAEGAALFTLDHLEIDLGGPKVVASAKVERTFSSGEILASGKARVTDLPVDALPGYWPPAIAPKPRKWIVASLHNGMIPVADFSVAVRGTDLGQLKLDQFAGELSIRGISVDYLTPMPLIHKGDALVHFAPGRIDIDVKDGSLTGLRITKGSVIITGLDQEDQDADIALSIVGPVRDALVLVDNKPLGYASKLGFKPNYSGGSATTQLSLKFPMAEDLSLEKIDILAESSLEKLFLGDVAFGKDLSRGTVDFRVNRKGISAHGTASLDDVPLNLEWEESFVPSTEFRSRYRIKGTLEDRQRAAFGLDFPPLAPPFMSGPLQTRMTVTLGHNGRGALEAEADLAGVQMSLPGLNWNKPAETPGHAEASVRFAKGKLTAVPAFTATSGTDLDVRGDVAMTETGTPRRVTFDRFRLGRSDVRGSMDLTAGGGLAFKLRGPAIDLAPILSGGQSDTASPPPAPDPSAPPLEIEVSTERLWASEGGHFDQAEALLSRKNGLWNRASLNAVVEGGKPVTLRLEPGASEGRFTVASEDAGGVLRALGIFETMIGGTLEVKGSIDTADVMTGACSITDFRVIKAPLLARLLTVTALTGILDSLTGEGLRFTHLDMPFTRSNGVLTITDAQASGPSLGLTAKGKVLTGTEHIDVEGTIVPAYVLNSLLGKIPLVGDLLTGEKGGGIFAATYSMKGPMEEPEVSVNPLAVLTPGFLRKLFHVFDGTETSGAEKKTDLPSK